MYDSGKIISGIIVFVGMFTMPFWYNIFIGKAAAGNPDISLPSNENKRCITGVEFMRSNHMKILSNWRYEAVRLGIRSYELDNKKIEISFTGTCLKCHSNTSQFCDRCHNYAGVSPDCWDCHTQPRMREDN